MGKASRKKKEKAAQPVSDAVLMARIKAHHCLECDDPLRFQAAILCPRCGHRAFERGRPAREKWLHRPLDLEMVQRIIDAWSELDEEAA